MTMMADWGETPAEVVRVLEENCLRKGCGHPRYRHGRIWRVSYWTGAHYLYAAAECSGCPCASFTDEGPITADDVLAAFESFRADGTLADFGIILPPETQP